MTNAANQTHIRTLAHFFEGADSQTLFDSTDSTYFRRLRDEICDALIQLLVWQRPFLEAERGLTGPMRVSEIGFPFSKKRPGSLTIAF